MTDFVDTDGMNDPDHGCRLFRVTGRVQGVFFRASTQTAARDLGLGGYAINRDDGSVEVFACGSLAAIDKLKQWLHHGPPMASVTAVAEQPSDLDPREDFSIGV